MGIGSLARGCGSLPCGWLVTVGGPVILRGSMGWPGGCGGAQRPGVVEMTITGGLTV